MPNNINKGAEAPARENTPLLELVVTWQLGQELRPVTLPVGERTLDAVLTPNGDPLIVADSLGRLLGRARDGAGLVTSLRRAPQTFEEGRHYITLRDDDARLFIARAGLGEKKGRGRQRNVVLATAAGLLMVVMTERSVRGFVVEEDYRLTTAPFLSKLKRAYRNGTPDDATIEEIRRDVMAAARTDGTEGTAGQVGPAGSNS